MSGQRSRNDAWLVRVSGAITVAAVIYLLATIGDPLRLNWGDPWSDCNVQLSGRSFARDGFVANSFVPTIDLEPRPATPLRYTHYPPGPDLVNGLEQTLLGPSDITVYRVPALALTLAALFFFYRFVRRTWSREVALFALPLFASSIIFLQYADTIHHIPLYWASGFFALNAGAAWLQDGRRRSLVGCIAGVFVCFSASYDFFFFLPIMLVTTILLVKPDWRAKDVRVLALGILGGAGLAVFAKTACVITAIGMRGFVDDLVHQFLERATSAYAVDYRDGFRPILLGRIWRFFGPLFYVAIAANVLGVSNRIRGADAESRIDGSPLLVLAAGVPFIALFSQLFCEQYHPTLALLPYYAIGGGSVLARGWTANARRWRAAAAAGFAISVTWQVIELARFTKCFLPREDAVAIRKVLDQTDRRRFVITNIPVDAAPRAYWNRHALGLPLEREANYLRDLFDTQGHDGPITAIEYLPLDRAIFDKLLYGYFAGERKWGWIADPFGRRKEWRERTAELSKGYASQLSPFGKVVFESESFRVRSVTFEDVDRQQRLSLPQGETRYIDFETRWASNYELYGFGFPEQYEVHHGFAWLRARRPTELRFTLKGLKFDPVGAPMRTSGLRVRLSPGADYRMRAFGWTEKSEQTLSLRVNGAARLETISAASPHGPRDYVFTIRAEDLHADGIQDLEFSFDILDKFDNGLLFHSVTFEPISPCSPSEARR